MRLYEKKKFFLTNSLSGKREEFKPANPPKVTYYSCGPTVYGPIHIGNARALIYADLMYRWLKHIGYDVNFVRNYTDVDDRIIDKAIKEKVDSIVVSERYVDYTETDIKLLGLLPPVKTVKVTDSIPEIIQTIQKIIERGHGYVVDGEVFFSVKSFPEYGKLSGKNVDDLEAGARVEVDAKKRHPADFSLWKPHKPGEPYWDSPWSKGRPGWHIECSAMVMRWLGDTIDLHHGGQDLIFPHHENEIAQSEAATGKQFCRHWTHHAFLTAGNEKMSKSIGNILPAREFIEKFGGELLKFIYLGAHHRSAVPYTPEAVSQSLNELERIYLAKKWAVEAARAPIAGGNGEPFKALIGKTAKLFEKIEDEMMMDLNTPGALGHLFSFIRDINRSEVQAAGKPGVVAPSSAERQQVAREFLEFVEKRLSPLWAVFGEDSDAALKRVEDNRRIISGVSNLPSDDELKKLLEERAEARKSKNFKRADEIRAQFDSYGLVIVDSPQGSSWKAKA